MKALTIAKIKTSFSDILVHVRNESIFKILYRKSKKPIAVIAPIEKINHPRKIGLLDEKAIFRVKGSGKITEDEFLG